MGRKKIFAVLAVCTVLVCILAAVFLKKNEGGNGQGQELVKEMGEKTGQEEYEEFLGTIRVGIHDDFKTVSTEEVGIGPMFQGYDADTFQPGYNFVDLNSDGVYELLLGGNCEGEKMNGGNPIYGIYGLREGQVVPIAVSGEGERFFLCKNGAIAKETYQASETGIPKYTYYTYYACQDLQLKPIETLIFDYSKKASKAWQYGKEEVSHKKAKSVRKTKAKKIKEEYDYKNLYFQTLVKKEEIQKKREYEKIRKEKELEAPRIYPDSEDLTFADLSGIRFWHGSGAGAWHTEIIIKPDGSFEGFFQDGNAESGYYYKYTEYECYFSGKFSDLTKTGPYEYTMKCTEFQTEGTVGEKHIRGETRIITSEPDGFTNADEVRLYLPGKLEKDLPKEYLGWYMEGLEYGVLTSYGLFNVGDGSGYTVYPIGEPVYEVGREDDIYEAESKAEARSDEEVKEIIDNLREDYDKESVKYSFADVAGISFWSARNAGSSSFELRPDGSFYGTCSDGMADMKYTGRFSSMEKIGPSAYLLKCEYTEITEYDGVEPIVPYPYGFDFANEFILYLREKDSLNPIGADSMYNIRGDISFVVPHG